MKRVWLSAVIGGLIGVGVVMLVAMAWVDVHVAGDVDCIECPMEVK